MQVAVSAKFSLATVCNLVGLTVKIVALSVRIVAMLLDWLLQQIPQYSQHQLPDAECWLLELFLQSLFLFFGFHQLPFGYNNITVG